MTLPDGLTQFLDRQRWFAEKGREYRVLGARPLGRIHDDPPVDVVLVDVEAEGRRSVYQLVLERRDSAEERLEHALVGREGQGYVYDALHDRQVTGSLLELIEAEATRGQLRFHRIGHQPVPPSGPSLVMTAEQSNTSLLFGDSLIMKMYRQVAPGVNPDVEVHSGLAAVGCTVIATPLGYLDSPEGTLAFLQEYLADGTDGWEIAKASVRDLFVEADLHPGECGGDFASDAERLGATTGQLHAALREAFPTGSLSPVDLAGRAARMGERLADAVAQVPDLAAFEPGLRRSFDALAALGQEVPSQRVHGDFHLGQTLRITSGWKVLDFEGEPQTPAQERRAPDTPLRDVAGMLRSIDYAARQVLLDHPDDQQRAYRAAEWVEHNRAAFLRGYGYLPEDDRAAVLLRALETEKAVYEVVYESRMRPTWLAIPLAAIERLAG